MVDWNVKTSPIHDGIGKEFKFANGYGASVVRFKSPFGSGQDKSKHPQRFQFPGYTLPAAG